MNNLFMTATKVEVRKVFAALAIFAMVLLSAQGLFARIAHAGNPSASLEQCRNGAADTPNNCEDLGPGSVGWRNGGNAGASNSHYVEGQSIPYRAILEDLTPGLEVTLTIEYDIKHSGAHAIDYITSYDRIAEVVDPVSGVTGLDGTSSSDTFSIPAPSSVNSPVPNQPTDSFDALPANEKVMSAWNADITDMQYVSEGDLTQDNQSTSIIITFTPSDATVVLAWGGHIGSRLDWGFDNDIPRSAGGISGSPYHSRFLDWSLGNLGNQDQQLSAGAVASPGNVTITKVVTNDNGGTLEVSDFPLFVGGTPVTSGVPADFDAGTYTVSETGTSTYTASSWGGDCDPSTGELVVEEGQSYSCTITNNDNAPSLSLNKIVSGGSASDTDFELVATGPTSISGFGSTTSGSDFSAGTYVLTENDNYAGEGSYSAGSWQCNGGTLENDNELTIALGEDVSCSITNTYIPPDSATLNVVKILTQDNGGTEDYSDFSFFVNGDEYAWDSGVATKTIIIAEADLGTYSVEEATTTDTVLGRYDVSYSNCTNLDLSFDGAEETCYITNDDIQPQLTVTKVVVNNSGTGSLGVDDFPLFVGSTSVTSGVQNGFDAGDYVVSETGDAGYSAAITGNCDPSGNVSLEIGDSKSCTITNDDLDPTSAFITVVKTVVNNDGGGLAVEDFLLFVDNTQVDSGVALEVFATGTYQMSETANEWYEAGDWGGDCNTDGSLTNVQFGQSYTCTITNDDIPGSSITIDKVVTGEQASESQVFSFTASGATSSDFSLAGETTPEAFTDLLSGTYTFTEGDVPDRWELVGIECTGASTSTVGVNLASSTVDVNLVAGENITCTFTNEYTPQDSNNNDENIVVRKEVTDGSDTETFFDFVITQLSGNNSGATTTFSLADGNEYDTGDEAAGEWYSVEEVNMPEYWSLASTSCETSRLGQDRDIDPYEFELREEETITCTFTNDQELFEIYGYVWHDDNEDGVWDENEDPLSGWAVKATNGNKTYNTNSNSEGYYSFMVPAGTWTLSETVQSGWGQTFPVVDNGTHTVTVPQLFEQELTMIDQVREFFIPTAHATFLYDYLTSYGSYDFGNNEQGGGGGGSRSPRCQAFDAELDGDEIILSWDTTRGNDLTIDADGVEIYTETDNDIVDEGSITIDDDGQEEFELTVFRSTRNDSCTVSIDRPTPEVLGEQVSVVPAGAANTGAGGTATIPAVAPWVALLRTTRKQNVK